MARQGLNVSTNVPVAADKITADNLLEQIIKVDIGAEGVSEPLTAGQKTKEHSLSVVLASDQGPDVDVLTLPGIAYKGEETITQDGASKACTLPANTNMVEISAEGGAVRYSINGAASADSGGFVPENQSRMVMHLSNLTSLAVFGASAAVKAHMLYWQEP